MAASYLERVLRAPYKSYFVCGGGVETRHITGPPFQISLSALLARRTHGSSKNDALPHVWAACEQLAGEVDAS